MSDIQRDLTRNTLAVFVIAVLIVASLWILRPFMPAAIWATMIVVATWPLMLRVQAYLWNRRSLAVAVMTIALLLVFVAPLSFAASAIVQNADRIVGWAQSITSLTMPAPPDWLDGLPLIGSMATELWTKVAAIGLEGLSAKAAPYAGAVTRWFISQVGGFGVMFIEFLLTVIFSAIIYAYGEAAAEMTQRFGHRLAGERGETSVRLAGLAIRGVALGVVVTAVIQSLLGGIGLAISGVPFASILTAAMFMLCFAHLGPALVLVPAVIWVYWSGSAGWGTFLLVWTILVISLDNILRPILIRRSVNLPLLLIFVGVVGGLIAFGIVGIFIGPVVLAVGYTLLRAWVDEDRPSMAAPGGHTP